MSVYTIGDAGEVENAQDAKYFHISSPFSFFLPSEFNKLSSYFFRDGSANTS